LAGGVTEILREGSHASFVRYRDVLCAMLTSY